MSFIKKHKKQPPSSFGMDKKDFPSQEDQTLKAAIITVTIPKRMGLWLDHNRESVTFKCHEITVEYYRRHGDPDSSTELYMYLCITERKRKQDISFFWNLSLTIISDKVVSAYLLRRDRIVVINIKIINDMNKTVLFQSNTRNQL